MNDLGLFVAERHERVDRIWWRIGKRPGVEVDAFAVDLESDSTTNDDLPGRKGVAMLTTVSTGDLIPADHPIRRIRVVVDAVLADLDLVFDEMYASTGRRSVPPEIL